MSAAAAAAAAAAVTFGTHVKFFCSCVELFVPVVFGKMFGNFPFVQRPIWFHAVQTFATF